MIESTTKLLSIPKAAKLIGVDREVVRAWTRRAVDPLPTVSTGEVRKVIAAEIDAWIKRNAIGG